MMGSALKNTGIQLLLDGVIDYLPSPKDVCFLTITGASVLVSSCYI